MSKLILKIENKIQDKNFLLTIAFSTDSSQETPFVFGNSTNSLERVNLTIEDANSIILEPVEIRMIIPKVTNSIETSISKDKNFEYDIKGNIEDKGSNILIKIKSISYLLHKNQSYSFYLEYRGAKSNVLIISF